MARYSREKLKAILEKTSGKCHLCPDPPMLKLEWYGRSDLPGGWEVDHSKPRAKGGTDHLNNLWAAHITCNRQKRTKATVRVRGKNGLTRAPLSRKARAKEKRKQLLGGMIGGALTGAVIGNPITAVLGALGLGLWAGSQDPDQNARKEKKKRK